MHGSQTLYEQQNIHVWDDVRGLKQQNIHVWDDVRGLKQQDIHVWDGE